MSTRVTRATRTSGSPAHLPFASTLAPSLDGHPRPVTRCQPLARTKPSVLIAKTRLSTRACSRRHGSTQKTTHQYSITPSAFLSIDLFGRAFAPLALSPSPGTGTPRVCPLLRSVASFQLRGLLGAGPSACCAVEVGKRPRRGEEEEENKPQEDAANTHVCRKCGTKGSEAIVGVRSREWEVWEEGEGRSTQPARLYTIWLASGWSKGARH